MKNFRISFIFLLLILLMMGRLEMIRSFSSFVNPILGRGRCQTGTKISMYYLSTSPSAPPVLFAAPPKKKSPPKIKPIAKPVVKSTSSLPEGEVAKIEVIPTELPPLDPTTITDEEFLYICKIVRKINTPKKLLSFIEECGRSGTLTWAMTTTAMRNYQFLNRTDLVNPVYDLFLNQSENPNSFIQSNLNTTQTIIQFLCKCGQVKLASDIATRAGVFDYTPSTEPPQAMKIDDAAVTDEKEIPKTKEDLFSTILSDIALGYAANQDYRASISTLRRMKEFNLPLSSELIGYRIISIFLAQSDLYFIKLALNSLLALDSLTDYDSLRQLTNYMIRKINFVKGAVSVETLPKLEYPEVIFMGRSNVGKSSLINLITNRKKLAYTSKTAGKTTEFNYYFSEGELGHDRSHIKFYLVDLPGVGYAKRSKDLRDRWKNLMNDYVLHRSNHLKCVFHLIDSRHGILESDYDCFDLLSILPPSVDYVVVFTKTDKFATRSSKKYFNGVSKQVLEKTKEELMRLTEGKREIPLLYTSSTHRDGGVDVLTAILNRITVEEENEK